MASSNDSDGDGNKKTTPSLTQLVLDPLDDEISRNNLVLQQPGDQTQAMANTNPLSVATPVGTSEEDLTPLAPSGEMASSNDFDGDGNKSTTPPSTQLVLDPREVERMRGTWVLQPDDPSQAMANTETFSIVTGAPDTGDIQGKEAGGSIANIPCRVCGGASSGFHFGALTCEGCKGFFRRMAKEREWNTYKCSKENACENVCKSCRYRKCLEAGMSVEASRIGRQPNAVKHAISVEARKQGTRVAEGKPAQNDQFSLDFAAFAHAHTKVPPAVIKQELDMEIVDETIRSVKDAWKELSALYTHEKISFDSHNLSIKDCQNTWRMLMVHFEFNAKCIIKFSKKLPKFQILCIEDQVSLIQMATYSLCILNHSQFYDVEKKIYRFFDFTKEEEQAILKYFPQFSIITNHFHHFGTLLKKPEFDETELAFLSSLVLLNTDNLSLKNKEGADKLHAELMESLQIYIERNHTDHEKRMGYLLLRISELALASLQHNQCVGAVAKANPELENQLWEEMYLK